jgi:hypothetical protein
VACYRVEEIEAQEGVGIGIERVPVDGDGRSALLETQPLQP